MALFDSLLSARDAIDDWLVNNPDKGPEHSNVYAARQNLTRALNTLVGIDFEAALGGLATDLQTAKACTDRLINVARTIDTAQQIVTDVGTVVQILGKVAGGAVV